MALDDPIEPFPADVDREAFGHWLSGFTDGEGSFGLYLHRWSATQQTRGYSARFTIALRADDLPALQLIRSFWGCGRLGTDKQQRLPRGKPSAVLILTRIADLCSAVIPHFERYPLRAKKARDFVIWRQGVELIRHVTSRKRRDRVKWLPEHHEEFVRLAGELRQSREFRMPE